MLPVLLTGVRVCVHAGRPQYVCHAEMNAILNKNSADVKGCSVRILYYFEIAILVVVLGVNTLRGVFS